jgi:hypothetical protein
MQLEISTVLIQWATGGLAFLWVTTRRREVGLGYGWLLRAVYPVLAAIGVLAVSTTGWGATLERIGGTALVAASSTALAMSVVRRRAGVWGQQERSAARRARVAAMTERLGQGAAPTGHEEAAPNGTKEFPPWLDLLAPAGGLVALFGAGAADGGTYALTLARLVTGAALLGGVTDAMLLGHWYLVQPGLGRKPIKELVRLLGFVWPVEVIVFLIPTGMVQVLAGSIDDGYGGLLAWIWLTAAITTIVLVVVTWLALRERYYSAVMAATGLLYLAILTAFGTDLVARAVLAT